MQRDIHESQVVSVSKKLTQLLKVWQANPSLPEWFTRHLLVFYFSPSLQDCWGDSGGLYRKQCTLQPVSGTTAHNAAPAIRQII